jgi:hypothetical protein
VLHRRAGTAIGGEAHAQHHLLQRRLAHRDLHRGRRGVGLRVDEDEGGIEVAAARQPQLGLHDLFLVVHHARVQPGQARHQLRVVALHAGHAQLAQVEQRPRIQPQAQLRRGRRRIDVGQAVADPPGRITPGQQLAGGVGLGAVPAGLGEGLAGSQRPLGADAFALCRRIRIGAGGDIALEIDDRLRHQGAGTGFHLDQQGGARARLAGDAHLRREIALRGQQLAGVLLGQHDQPRDLGVVQVAHLPVAAQLQVALEQFAQRVGRAHDQVERGGLRLGLPLDLGLRLGRGRERKKAGDRHPCRGEELAEHGAARIAARRKLKRRRMATHAGWAHGARAVAIMPACESCTPCCAWATSSARSTSTPRCSA